MEISVKETQNVRFNYDLKNNPEIIGTMSMAVKLIDQHYQGIYRELRQPSNKNNSVKYSVLGLASSENGVDYTRSKVTALSPTLVKKNRDKFAVEDPTIMFFRWRKICIL